MVVDRAARLFVRSALAILVLVVLFSFAWGQEAEEVIGAEVSEPYFFKVFCILNSEIEPFSAHLRKVDAHRGVVFLSADRKEEGLELLARRFKDVTSVFLVVFDVADCDGVALVRYPTP